MTQRALPASGPSPAKILRDSMGLGGAGVERNKAFSNYTESVAQQAIEDLADAGYVLVNAEMLAAALPESFEPFWNEEPTGNEDARDGMREYVVTFDRDKFAAAILAALKEGAP